ncbi:sialic acid-binding Ig-like lectin 14 [Discoglossus pictus]
MDEIGNFLVHIKLPKIYEEELADLDREIARVTGEDISGYELHIQRRVTVQRGLCAAIPCNFTANNKNRFSGNIKGYWTTCTSPNTSGKRLHCNFYRQYKTNKLKLIGELSNGDCSLTISDANKKDEGLYYFRFEGEDDIKYNYLLQYLSLSVSDLTEMPEISFSKILVAGEEVTLTCTAPGICSRTPPKIIWETKKTNFKNEIRSKVMLTQENYRNSILTYSSTFKFTPSQKDHNKNISCKVTFPALPASTWSTVTLNIQYPPSISVSIGITGEIKNESVIVKEGTSLTLSCFVNGNPNALVLWMKGDKPIDSAVIIDKLERELVNITYEEAGTYMCSATNVHGTTNRAVTISVEHPPFIAVTIGVNGEIKNEPVIVKEGTTLTLSCSVKGNPNASVIWIKGDKPFDFAVIKDKLERKLVNITYEEAGTYMCLATNKHGKNNRTVIITVELTKKHFGDTFRNVMIGGAFGVILLVSVIIIMKLYTKIRVKKKLDSKSTEEPAVEDASQLYSNVNITVATDPSKTAVYGNTSMDSVCDPGEQELHYASICFSKSSPNPCLREQDTEYSEIKLTVDK